MVVVSEGMAVSDFKQFVVWSYHYGPGWTVAITTDNFLLALKTWLREKKRTHPVLLTVNLGTMEMVGR